jgi:hypothetical protein
MRPSCSKYSEIFTKRFASGGNASEAPASDLGQQTDCFRGSLELSRQNQEFILY